jgi:hypothetical protein
MTAFTSQPLISSTFGSRHLIRKNRADEVRVHGCPVPSRYGTDGLLTSLAFTHNPDHPHTPGAVLLYENKQYLSCVKQLIEPRRNARDDEMIKANECLLEQGVDYSA